MNSQLFTVRLWTEDISPDRVEIRGRAQHVLSGEAGYFRTWPELSAFLTDKLHESDPAQRELDELEDDADADAGASTLSGA